MEVIGPFKRNHTDQILERHVPGMPNSVVLGHKRLSIIDTSQSSHQPMYDQTGRYAIVFNGEIYNYPELRKEIGGQYPWRTSGDTEVLLACFALWGEKMLGRLDGMFAFVILDTHQSTVFMARDVVGIKPLYYYQEPSSGMLLFASEPAAISKALPGPARFDARYFSEFLLLGVSDHAEGCMIQDVKQLRGGSFMRYDLKKKDLVIGRYYTPIRRERRISQEEFNELLYRAVQRQMRADVKVGTSLSGGIDSSAVVSTVGEILAGAKETYSALTFSFQGFESDESDLARRIAETNGIAWVPVEPEISNIGSDLERMIGIIGEPFSSLSMFAQYKVMEKARAIGIKVMLDGQGGDELYLGYPRMAQRVGFEYLVKGKIGPFIREWQGLKTNLSIPLWQSLAGQFYFNNYRIAFPRRLKANERYVDRDYLNLADQDLVEDFYAPKSVREKQEDELFRYCLPRLLRYADRNSMASSVEARVPHLSNLMIDVALEMPLDQKVSRGWTKLILREYINGRVPDEVTWNKVKRGFDVPQQFWVTQMKKQLTAWVDQLPDDGPLKKENLRLDLENNPGSKFLWPVLSAAALHKISGIEF
jgi:asparagine synthase (glutamine-hydrolysing)